MMSLRNLAKWGFRGVALILTLPLVLVSRLEEFFSRGSTEVLFKNCGEVVAVVPTALGSFMRGAFYSATCKRVSWDAYFLLGSMVAHRDTTIGKGTIIGAWNVIGYSDLGNNVMCAGRVTILSGRHQHGDSKKRISSRESSDLNFKRVSVGDNCWIGEGAIITENVGSNCTIGAGAVLFKDADPDCTYLGNPARRVNVKSDS